MGHFKKHKLAKTITSLLTLLPIVSLAAETQDTAQQEQLALEKIIVTAQKRGENLQEVPLAIEFRHTDWYNNETVSNQLYDLLETNNVSNVLVDTAGRRDLLHMRLTNATAFVRYVGANHPSDYTRLDDWVKRLKEWQEQGVKEIDFFIHQNIEKESPLLSSYFIKKLNKELGCQLKIPNEDNNDNSQQKLL